MLFSDANIPFLLASLAFVVICLLSMGIIIYFGGVRYRREMIDKIRPADSDYPVEKDSPSLDLYDGSGNAFVKFLSAVAVKTNPGRSADDADIKFKFLRGGLRGRNVPTVFWGTKFFLAIVLPVAFLVVAVVFFKTMHFNHMLLGAMFLAMLGLFLPDMWLRVRTSGRKQRLAKGFPDALDLMVVCVEAGMGLDAAISRVGEELGLSHPELSRELNLLNLDLRAGKPRQAALRNLADRMDIDDARSLVTVLIQTDRFGTSVAQALRVFSDSFRTARYQKAEEIAAKIGTKLLFPLVLCIFPAIFMITLAPAAIRIYRVMFAASES
jgi:tight adherence protein C